MLKDSELVEQGTHEALLAGTASMRIMHTIQTPEGAKIA